MDGWNDCILSNPIAGMVALKTPVRSQKNNSECVMAEDKVASTCKWKRFYEERPRVKRKCDDANVKHTQVKAL